ncbi:MAG TPA: PKD domain-containing protein [Candidatus Portnoybacteria bacterium]|nr:PKD domain-containing protein [Candidatus Portnoybacteria bacterium]
MAVLLRHPQEHLVLSDDQINFDGSTSSDPDGDELSFFWNFGDGTTSEEVKPTHTYLYPSTYLVTLEVSDGQIKSTDQLTVTIYSSGLVINEFLPNPKGDDKTGEWIELFNNNDLIADLSGWQLDDEEDGSSPFTFPSYSLLGPYQYLVLPRATTDLALNNDEDTVRLLYPNGVVASQVSYSEVSEGQSSNRTVEDSFLWSTAPTPGLANIISAASQPLGLTPDYSEISQSTKYPESSSLESKLKSEISTTEFPDEPDEEISPETESTQSSPDPEEQLATAKEPTSRFPEGLKAFLIALGLGIIGAIGLLLLRKRLKS